MWKIDNGSDTGTTGAEYADALSWSCAELANKSILLTETGGAQSLKYKLLGYYTEGGQADELVAETTLAASGSARFQYHKQYHTLILQVKNGDGAATYQVDYEGTGV